MLILRRFLVIAALMFWQGGFTFYAGVVVPVGQDVLGSHLRQGFITRRVAVFLNLSGAVALVPLALDLLARDPSRCRRLLRGLLWAALLLTLGALVRLHAQLDELLVPRGRILLDPEAFRPRHRLYLWVTTAQWGCALAYLLLTLRAWRAEDRRPESPPPPGVEGHRQERRGESSPENVRQEEGKQR